MPNSKPGASPASTPPTENWQDCLSQYAIWCGTAPRTKEDKIAWLFKQWQAARAAQPQSQQPSQWISVEEKLPPESKELVWYLGIIVERISMRRDCQETRRVVRMIHRGLYLAGENRTLPWRECWEDFYDNEFPDDSPIDRVTHWMPLPSVPIPSSPTTKEPE